uniref:Glucosidase II subunit alpha n=1 Tax=Chromera velia CCMP2878 TaxID=1169474 RepID=A0A0G4I9S4_9ALVE|eukprot:Cvel_12230.t1-p1 / transcript=Cvel_12230.t1 / gene=Cvel_12230 / organism=Chromera_velia_CCMP2878 / gene_product=Neutral alpha-glucosidase AB, putative / transcript_product=Neutral alpha-glucosidase AB, putative / location=Cvel_scaffold792:776-10025(+) / protein_length=1113 / sequence_SO=supercontig / SO=protein_coding / is_pseudo=false
MSSAPAQKGEYIRVEAPQHLQGNTASGFAVSGRRITSSSSRVDGEGDAEKRPASFWATVLILSLLVLAGLFTFVWLLQHIFAGGRGQFARSSSHCTRMAFCRRYKDFTEAVVSFTSSKKGRRLEGEAGDAPAPVALYEVIPASLKPAPPLSGKSVEFSLHNVVDKSKLSASLTIYKIGVVRLQIEEIAPLFRRYAVPSDLIVVLGVGDVVSEVSFSDDADGKSAEIVFAFDDHTGRVIPSSVKILFAPFRVDVFVEGRKVQSFCERQLLNFEKFRVRTGKAEEGEILSYSAKRKGDDGVGWEDAFAFAGGEGWEHVSDTSEKAGGPDVIDSNPKGPASVGIDVSFAGGKNAYGLPSHYTDFEIPFGDEPYRLFNVDEYGKTKHPHTGTYGTVPFLAVRHETEKGAAFSGMYWNNPAETFVQLQKGEKGAQSWWSAESGSLDVFAFLGPSPRSLSRQLHGTTGFGQAVPLWSLGAHVCRWIIDMKEEDIWEWTDGFDRLGIPVDTVWMDIGHTDGKRYWTWASERFPDPEGMMKRLEDMGRRGVTIHDPHLKKDESYFVYKELLDAGGLVRKHDGSVFTGSCWPGESAWADVTSGAVRYFLANLYSPSRYPAAKYGNLYTWNDMNEPAIFEAGKDKTMPRDALHAEDVEHRDVHNLYGHLFAMATWEGQRARDSRRRPFILTRSYFAGIQRQGAAVWTGDNRATASDLLMSVDLLLSLSHAGVPFIGADVGGFFGNPSEALLLQWHRLGVWYPFYRQHSNPETKRREPWLFSEKTQRQIKESVLMRYSLTPYWYVTMLESVGGGVPVLRGLWYDFPGFEKGTGTTAAIRLREPTGQGKRKKRRVEAEAEARETRETEEEEEQEELHPRIFQVGDAFAVVAVAAVDSDASPFSVSLPLDAAGPSRWFDWNAERVVKGQEGRGSVDVECVPSGDTQIPIFVRGGSIVPTKDAVAPPAVKVTGDLQGRPFELRVFVNGDGSATGRVFVDKGDGYEFESGDFLYRRVVFSSGLSRAHEGSVLKVESIPLTLQGGARSVQGGGEEWTAPEGVSDEVSKVLVYGLACRPSSASLDPEGSGQAQSVPMQVEGEEGDWKATLDLEAVGRVKLRNVRWKIILR